MLKMRVTIGRKVDPRNIDRELPITQKYLPMALYEQEIIILITDNSSLSVAVANITLTHTPTKGDLVQPKPGQQLNFPSITNLILCHKYWRINTQSNPQYTYNHLFNVSLPHRP